MNFKIYNGLIYIKAAVYGKLGNEKISAVIDTASTVTAIKTDILDRLGYSAREGKSIKEAFSISRSTEQGYLIKIQKLEIGDIITKDLNVFALDLVDVPNFPRIDCLVGSNFLQHFKVIIDYANRNIFFHENSKDLHLENN